MPDALNQALASLLKLRSGDRNAILKKLTLEQRRTLARLNTARPAGPAPAPPAKPALPPCSPWLASRLAKLLQSSDASITDAARGALRAISAGPAP